MAPTPIEVETIWLQLTTHLLTLREWKAELTWLADLQQTVYPHKWSPISWRSSVWQGKFAGQDQRSYHCTMQPTVLDPRVGHTMDVLSPFISVLCHSDWLFHGESCPGLDVVHPGCVWSSSPACTWHCSLHYLFLQTTPLFPHGLTIVC